MIRLFTALEIPDEVAEKLVRLQRGLEGARWIERPDLHITLRFMGDVPENVADDIDQALSEIPVSPFEIELEGLGEFGGKRPHTLYAGVKPSEPLRILQGRHETAMRRVGLKPETRNFTPHVTIARLSRVETGAAYDFIRANSPFATPAFTAERFTLFSARASTGGGPYVAEKHYPDVDWEWCPNRIDGIAAVPLPKVFLDELKGRIRISEVVGRKVKLARRDREFVWLSPFSNEKSPSFTVNDDKQFYHCFSSGEHGDVIKFLEKAENLSFIEAVERLAAEAGMEMPERDAHAAQRDKEAATLIDVMEMAAQFFRQKLAEGAGAEARAYLKRRGMRGKTIDNFGIGYAPGDDRGDRTSLLKYLKSKNVTLDQMAEAGLVISGPDIAEPYDRFRNRVMFPIADTRGRVIAFGGRALSADTKAKYLNSPETPLFHKGRVLYNLFRARKPAHDDGTVIAVEGYMDVVGLAQGGIYNAVAPLGTALTEDQIQLLWRMAPEPILCFDGDKAGLRAACRAVERVLPLLKPGHSLRFALLPEGKDPDDLVREEGGDAMREIFAKARPLSEMLWEKKISTGQWDTPERRAKLEADLEAAIAAIADPKVRGHYARALRERVAKFFGASRRPQGRSGGYGQGGYRNNERFGNRPFREKGFGRGEVYVPPATTQLKQSSLVTGRGCTCAWEDMLLAVLLDYPVLVAGHAEEISGMSFHTVEGQRLRDAILDCVSTEESAPEPDVLREKLSNAGFRGALRELNERILSDRSGFFMSLKSFERAEQCIAEILTVKSRSIRLLSEIKAAEEALARDMSDENFHRLRTLMLESRRL